MAVPLVFGEPPEIGPEAGITQSRQGAAGGDSFEGCQVISVNQPGKQRSCAVEQVLSQSAVRCTVRTDFLQNFSGKPYLAPIRSRVAALGCA